MGGAAGVRVGWKQKKFTQNLEKVLDIYAKSCYNIIVVRKGGLTQKENQPCYQHG